MIPRPLAASIASCISQSVFHPLDTKKTVNQLEVLQPGDYYKGIVSGSSGAFLTSGIYYSIYEQYRVVAPFALTIIFATSLAGIVSIPFDFDRKRRQLNIDTKMTWNIFQKTYVIFLVRTIPKNILKMFVYEKLLYIFSKYFSAGLCGLLSSIISTIMVFFILYPLDIWNTYLLSEMKYTLKDLIKFKGANYGILHKLSTNALGFYCLEILSPRYY